MSHDAKVAPVSKDVAKDKDVSKDKMGAKDAAPMSGSAKVTAAPAPSGSTTGTTSKVGG